MLKKKLKNLKKKQHFNNHICMLYMKIKIKKEIVCFKQPTNKI